MDEANMSELIGEIKDLCHDASTLVPPSVVPLKGYPDHISPVWTPATATLTMMEAPVAPRKYLAGDLGDVVRLVNEFAARLTDPAPIFVWVFEGTAIAVLDEQGTRRERVTFKLTQADGFTKLRTNNARDLDQKAMVGLLRTGIDGQYDPPNILTLVRSLKFNSSSAGTSSIQAGKSNMGKSVEMAVAGQAGEALPEDLAITLPVYDDFLTEAAKADDVSPEQFTVRCAFDADPENQTFKITAKAGELARVLLEADTRLMHRLASGITAKNVRVFRGKPE